MRLKLFWLPKRRVTSFFSPGDGSTGSARFWKMCDVRPQEAATVALDGGAWCRRKKVISRWFSKKTFYSLLQHKGHSQCMRHMGRGSLE